MNATDIQRHVPTRALLVIEQVALAAVIKLALNHSEYVIRVAPTLKEVATALVDWKPELVILDMDIAASAVLERVREATPRGGPLPVIALTRRGDLISKLTAFDRGVDDILSVPFSPEEFVARVSAIMRRIYRRALVFTPVLRFGDLDIDISNRRVRVAGKDLRLTSLEQSLLYVLAANAGHVVTRDEILDCLWGSDYVAESNVVDRHIRNLRVKLQSDSHRTHYIATVPGRGYRFTITSVK